MRTPGLRHAVGVSVWLVLKKSLRLLTAFLLWTSTACVNSYLAFFYQLIWWLARCWLSCDVLVLCITFVLLLVKLLMVHLRAAVLHPLLAWAKLELYLLDLQQRKAILLDCFSFSGPLQRVVCFRLCLWCSTWMQLYTCITFILWFLQHIIYRFFHVLRN
jgi:hypothetical protein